MSLKYWLSPAAAPLPPLRCGLALAPRVTPTLRQIACNVTDNSEDNNNNSNDNSNLTDSIHLSDYPAKLRPGASDFSFMIGELDILEFHKFYRNAVKNISCPQFPNVLPSLAKYQNIFAGI